MSKKSSKFTVFATNIAGSIRGNPFAEIQPRKSGHGNPTAEIHSRKSIRGNPGNRGKLKKRKKNIEMQEEGKTFTPKVKKERPFLNQTDLVTQPAPKRRGEG